MASGPRSAGESSGRDVEGLVRQMTLAEKMLLVHGIFDPKPVGEAGYWPGLPRLGIPPLRFADGAAGVNLNKDATAMPAPVGLAATFNPEAARLFGVVLGREAKALEQDVFLAPYVNIVRDPLFRRNHTTLSEDPLLAARLGAGMTIGIQNQGVMAQVKHLAGYNGLDNVVIDERTLHEIYLPAFEAAVKAGAASVMCAYNKINGSWACESAELQDDILRGQWGFKGFVTSDWGAVHTPSAITRGLDLEMPGRKISGRNGPYFTDSLKAAIETGAIPVSAVDQAVSRILGQMDRFGLLGRNPPARPASIDIAADAAIVRDIAQQGAVLLKNDGNALPLTADDLGSLAVIGPTGGQVAAGFMGERAYGFESRLVAPLTALQKLEPKAKIRYSAGVDLTGVPIPNFKSLVSLEPDSEGSWTGTVNASRDGNYTFMVQPATGGASRGSGTITVDGRVVARTSGPGFGGGGRVAAKKWSSLLPTTDGRDNARGAIHLAAGAHRIEASAQSTGEAPLSVRFAWMTPDLRRAGVEAAVEAAKAARTPVVFAWNEAGDALALPEDQDELIERVAAANPRTIVVLNTGGPIAMPWRDKVRAILQMWFSGQEGGWATADILLGRANPSGKLPVTFPARLEDAPARAAGHPERWTTPPAPGSSGISANSPAVNFSEGIAVGYRWYDQQNIQPLFPFGHGLSYTRFEYSGLAVERNGDGLDVSFNLRNAGSRKGAEVAQAYVGPAANAPVPMAQKSLVGFERIELDAGQAKRVTMHIDARGLSYWSTQKHGWALARSARPLYVGSSSRDIRIEGKVSLN